MMIERERKKNVFYKLFKKLLYCSFVNHFWIKFSKEYSIHFDIKVPKGFLKLKSFPKLNTRIVLNNWQT